MIDTDCAAWSDDAITAFAAGMGFAVSAEDAAAVWGAYESIAYGC